ncbi:hypothetical protein RclHR1_00970013 [Rhizophagus clarus]|uniref:Centrosomal protein of 135 kDa n=1 Tax=Rhizophagus clarus TaxID=94130 RepID=A0A2Z6SJ12_9GLOM|nr:hypothetical protein RclHR1_00970013 [Rhizophagus clarus]
MFQENIINNDISLEYNELKQHLIKLDYHENFTSESIPLIKKLLNGLYTITENYQILHAHSQKVEKERWDFHCQVEPLKRSLAAVTKENNQLHADLIQKADVCNKEHSKNKFLIRKYEKENADLKFLNSQYLIQTQLAEKKLVTEKKKIEELLLIYNDTNITSGKEFVFESIEREEFLDPMSKDFDVLTPQDPHVVDIVQQCQKIIRELEQSNKKLSDKEKNLQEQILNLQQQIVSREKEIARLGSLLINKRSGNFDVPSSSDANSKVQQLETQLEYLQEYIMGLEQDRSELEKEKMNVIKKVEEEKQEILEELQDAREENVKLFNELQKLEHLSNELGETDTHSRKTRILASILSNNEEEPRQELGQSTNTWQLKVDFENVSNENDQLRVVLDKASNEIESLRKDLQSTTDRLRNLYTFAVEGSGSTKPLNIQSQKIPKVPLKKSPNNENVMMQTNMENEENMYSEELESLKQEQNDLFEQFHKELERIKAQLNIEKERVTSITKERNDFEDLYKQLNLKLQTQCYSTQNHDQCRKEMDQVNSQLNKAREEIKTISDDRQKLELMYNQVNQELQNLKMMPSQTLENIQKTENEMANLKLDLESQRSSRVNDENKHETLEAEVKEARKFIRRMEQELSSIRDRFQEREKAFENLKKENDGIIIERDKLLADFRDPDQYGSAFDDITNVTRGNKIFNQFTEVTKHRNQLLAKLEDKENHVKYLNNLIITKDQEKEILMDSYRKSLEQQQKLDNTIRNTSQESNNLKMEILLRDRRAQQLQKTLEEEIKQYKAELLNYERRCDTLTRMLENVQRDLAQSESEKASLLREKDDQLVGITGNKSVNIVMEKLEEVRDENKYLKRQMEILESQLQGRQTGISTSDKKDFGLGNNSNFGLRISTSDELLTSSKGFNSNASKSKQFDFGLSSRQTLNNVDEDKIPSFPIFGSITNQLDKDKSRSKSPVLQSSFPKTETQDYQVHLLNEDNARLKSQLIQMQEELQQYDYGFS